MDDPGEIAVEIGIYEKGKVKLHELFLCREGAVGEGCFLFACDNAVKYLGFFFYEPFVFAKERKRDGVKGRAGCL